MIFQIVYVTANIAIPFLICVGTILGVFQNRGKCTRRQLLYMFCFLTAVTLIIQRLLRIHLKEAWEFFYVLAISAVIIIGCKYAFRCGFTEIAFVFLVIKCYMDAIFCIAKMIQVCAIHPLFRFSEAESFGVGYIISFVLTSLPMWLFVRWLLRPLIDKTEHMHFWYIVWTVPLLLYLLYRHGVSPRYESPEQIIKGVDWRLTLNWIAATFAALVIMVKMMLEATRTVEEREKSRAIERQLLLQQEQYVKIQRSVEYARKLGHDQRHHFLAIRGLAQDGEVKELEKYLDEYMDQMLMEEPVMVCENYAVNAVIQHMLSRAGRGGVQIAANVDVSEDCKAATSDMVVLIGNLLENAVEACERQTDGEKFVDIRVTWASERMLVVVVKNSYSNQVKEKEGVFWSTKSDREGIGISSVREIAEKYNGVAKFEYTNLHEAGVFQASILLNL